MVLHSKSAKITNLERQLALERNKYSELVIFAYHSSRKLIEVLGDMKSCLDVATRDKVRGITRQKSWYNSAHLEFIEGKSWGNGGTGQARGSFGGSK